MQNTAPLTDVLEIAIDMERMGRDFYQVLAYGRDEAQVRAFCLMAAKEKARHLTVFQKMHDEVEPPGSARVDLDLLDQAARMAKQQIQPAAATVHRVAVGGNLKDALRMAIRMEEDAVSFYEQLGAALPGSAQVIRAIANEERKHLSALRAVAA